MISRLAVLGTLSCFLLSSITKAQEEHLGTHNLRAGKAQEEQAEEDEQVSRRTLRTPVKFDSENIQRVVGGNDVVVGEYPYYVDMDGCGGSLIAPDLILSAAHCGRYRGSFVTVGALYPDNDSTAGATEVKVVRWARHPNYNANTLDNDFAIMQISPPVTLTSSVTFSINDSRNIQEGEDLTVIGLGLLEENANNDGAPILQEGTVQAISHSDCNSWYRGGVTDANMFCAGKEEGGIDSCQGDSGGPIVRKIGNSHVQVGVVSWGIGCAQQRRPGVYSRVSFAYDWIKNVGCNQWGSSATFCDAITAGDDTGDDTGGSSCAAGQIEFDLSVTTDNNGRDTRWFLIDRATRRRVEVGRGLPSNETIEFKKCIPASNYKLVIRDRSGNG
mmetsp:Transcript_38306/g.92666  ORF Transcript_38306/g.92666 Transcript_38306/m.92666 type:complete len:387 (+) Transcript_38306:154-1314(+)